MKDEVQEVRARVLVEHERLRGLLEAVGRLASRVARGAQGDIAPLRELGLELHAHMVVHLEMEDRELVPLLRKAGEWGEARARQLGREHAEQRMLLEYIVARLRDERRPAPILGSDLESFAELLIDDMDDEERSLLDRVSRVSAAERRLR